MKVTAPFIWDQVGYSGCWLLSLQLGQIGRATVERVGTRYWRWSTRGFLDREPAEGKERTREAAMMAAQRAILTKSGRQAPTPRQRQEALVTV